MMKKSIISLGLISEVFIGYSLFYYWTRVIAIWDQHGLFIILAVFVIIMGWMLLTGSEVTGRKSKTPKNGKI